MSDEVVILEKIKAELLEKIASLSAEVESVLDKAIIKAKIGRCPFCDSLEADAGYVWVGNSIQPSHQVSCGSCGRKGPVMRDAEKAIRGWEAGINIESIRFHPDRNKKGGQPNV